MSFIEKICVLWFYELKLLIRSREKLIGALWLPLIGAVCFGLAGKPVGMYGLFFILPASSLLITQSGLSDGIVGHMPARGGLILGATSRTLVVLFILTAQAALYTGVIALIHPISIPQPAIFAASLALALIIRSASRFSRLRST